MPDGSLLARPCHRLVAALLPPVAVRFDGRGPRPGAAQGMGRSVQFDVLGRVRARRDGQDVRIGPPQHETVLAALLVDAGRVVDVDLLARRVWDDRPPANALASLQAVISRLRRALGDTDGTLIETAAPGYRLAVAVTAVDEGRFAELVQSARRTLAAGDVRQARTHVQDALALWRGPAYEGIRAEFARHEASRLVEHRLAAVELAAELDLDLGLHQQLTQTLGPEVAAHPLREGLCASLVLALYRSGRQAEALHLYENTRQVLAEELGVDPGRGLAQLHLRILAQDPDLAEPLPAPTPLAKAEAETPAPAPTPAQGVTGPATRNDLVGRRQELADCQAVVDRALSGQAGGAVLIGEAGIGKTRLVEETAAHAAAQGMAVAWGRSFDHSGSPAYWPWAQVLTALAEQFGAEQTARAADGRSEVVSVLVPDLAGRSPQKGPGQPAPADRGQLFDAVGAIVRNLSRDRPICVVLEDQHWADPESSELTEYLLSTVAGARVAMLVTVRTPNENPDRSADALLGAVSRLRQVSVVRLSGLNTDDARRYAELRLGREIDADAATRLHARTEGNPFFIGELVRLLAEERRLTGSAPLAVPGSVRAVIDRRLRHLAPSTRSVLSVCALVGRTVDLRVVADVTGDPLPRLAAALDPAVAAGVLVADPERPGQWLFSHALVQDALAEGTGPMHRSVLHAQIAEAIESRNRGRLDDVAAVLAHHYAAAGDLGNQEQAARMSLLAAHVAQRSFAFADAERQLDRALQLAAAVGGRTALELELQCRVQLGTLLTLRAGYNDPAVLEQRRLALDLAREAGTSAQLLSSLWGVWGNALVSGDFGAADGFAAELLAAAERTGDAMLLLAGHHARGQVRYHRGRLRDARHDLETAWELARQHRSDVAVEVFIQHPLMSAPAWLAKVLALLGEVDEADAAAQAALRAADEVGHDFTSVYLEILEGWRAMFLRRGTDARAAGERGAELAARHGFDQLSAFVLTPLGWGRAATGDAVQGVADVRLGNELFSSLPGGHMFGHAMLTAIADIQSMSGDADAALATTEEALAESARTGERFYLPMTHLVRASALRDLGEATEQVVRELDAVEALIVEQSSQLFSGRLAELREAVG